MVESGLKAIRIVGCVATRVTFDDASYEITHAGGGIKVALDGENYAIVSHESQEVAYESRFEREFAVSVDTRGEIDHTRHVFVSWEDEISLPVLLFRKTPQEVVREYAQGQSIELGLEDVTAYLVSYRDGVEARFERSSPTGFKFSFSTGFYGSFWQDPDGSFTLKFKGDRLKATEEAYSSQSKFIVSRSKYSGNLLLILQDDATVRLV